WSSGVSCLVDVGCASIPVVQGAHPAGAERQLCTSAVIVSVCTWCCGPGCRVVVRSGQLHHAQLRLPQLTQSAFPCFAVLLQLLHVGAGDASSTERFRQHMDRWGGALCESPRYAAMRSHQGVTLIEGGHPRFSSTDCFDFVLVHTATYDASPLRGVKPKFLVFKVAAFSTCSQCTSNEEGCTLVGALFFNPTITQSAACIAVTLVCSNQQEYRLADRPALRSHC
ncbi:hypothetical protein COO60DRAFT_1491097, partial [Scenedesmus sp. NREL 46B-D3]